MPPPLRSWPLDRRSGRVATEPYPPPRPLSIIGSPNAADNDAAEIRSLVRKTSPSLLVVWPSHSSDTRSCKDRSCGGEPLSPRCPSLAICNAHRASCTANPVGAADASGCPFDRTHVREGTIAEIWPAACVCASGRESMVFDRLIAMPRRSIDRTPDPGRPDAGIVRGGGRSTPSLGSSLADRGGTCPGCTNFNVIPATSSSSGVSRAAPMDGPASRGVEPAPRPRNDRTVAPRRTPA